MTDLQIKYGDRLRLHEVVVEDDKPMDGPGVYVGCNGARGYITRNLIAEVLPRAIAVGDRVRTGGGDKGGVLAIHSDYAWVDIGDDLPLTEEIDNLTRIEADE